MHIISEGQRLSLRNPDSRAVTAASQCWLPQFHPAPLWILKFTLLSFKSLLHWIRVIKGAHRGKVVYFTFFCLFCFSLSLEQEEAGPHFLSCRRLSVRKGVQEEEKWQRPLGSRVEGQEAAVTGQWGPWGARCQFCACHA